jgi:Nucleotide modification associated domain 3
MRIALLRVGLDTGCNPAGLGPIFPDGSFELVWIPDSLNEDARRYDNTTGRYGRPFIEYLSAGQRVKAAGRSMHVDPEFVGFTYGDPVRLKSGLRKLQPNDVLAFYAGLRPYGWRGEDALYLIGYFRIAEAKLAPDVPPEHCIQAFSTNAHVCNRQRYARDFDHLLLIRGGPGSRLFERAVRISQRGQDRSGKPLHILSDEMVQIFGDFGGRRSIQRSPPRWVPPEHTHRAWTFLSEAVAMTQTASAQPG